MNEEKLEEDPWEWRKYRQKPIKGSEHPRLSYIQNFNFDMFFFSLI